VRFRILGPLEVRAAQNSSEDWREGSGEDWSGFSAPKLRALLAALLLSPGQAVSTDGLVDELWGDNPPAKAASQVAVYVHRLRAAIGDPDGRLLITRAPGYRLLLGSGDLDAARFAGFVTEGREALAAGEPDRAAALLAEALGLYRGKPLADVPPSELVTAETERLEESRVEAVGLRSEAEIECGRADGVVAGLRRLTADHPLREELWALLMRALYAVGRQAEALETYERARGVIADQLGVDPGPRLRQLHQEILDADARPVAQTTQPSLTAGQVPPRRTEAPPRVDPAPPPVQVVPSQLPADLPDFTGRAENVKYLCHLLADVPDGADRSGGAVVVSLVAGTGGLGKTTLAVHTAHRLRARFADGQLYVNLQGATSQPAVPADVLARFLRELGVDAAQVPVSVEERAALYRTRLAGRRILIVLDDARDAAQVRPLLPGSASCGVLVTSRGRLPDLVGSRLVDLDVLDKDEARALLVRIVGARRLAAEPEATAEVLAACAGLPLAIRIAGARLATRTGWTIKTLARRLADEHRRIDEFRVGDLAIRACFQVSFATLPAADAGGVDPARAFRLLGLWQGPSIGLAAAAALVGEPEDDVADALEVLVDAHLLQSPAAERYRCHDLLRVYAAERAEAEEARQDRDDAVRRVLTWYLHTAEAAACVISPHHTRVALDAGDLLVAPLAFGSLEEALRWCETERAGLVAATKQAAGYGLHEIAWKLPAAAMSFFYRRSHWANWVTTHEAGLDSARKLGDRRAEAWMLNNLGMAFGLQRMEEAVGCFEQALAIDREIGDLQGETRAANNVATANFRLRRFEKALDAAERSLVIQRQAGNRYGEGIALGNLGCACRELGRLDDAVDRLQRALVIFRELRDQRAEAESLSDLGGVYIALDRVDQAIGCLGDSLAIWQAIGDRRGQAATLTLLGRARHQQGRRGDARELLIEAYRIFEELGDQSQAAELRSGLAELTEAAR